MNEYQHAVMIMNSLNIDEHQKDQEYEKFLEIIQFSHETISVYIDRFKARKLQAKDLGLPQNDIITKNTFLDGILQSIRDKIKDGLEPRTYLEAKRRVKDVFEDDGLTVKGQANSMAGSEAYVEVLESQITEMRKENEKIMFLFEKMIEQRTSTLPSLLSPFVPKVERPRIVCSHCAGVGHPVDSC